ncbi:hypothetical protein UAY_03157 [Enterococcus moraviensis ATCC BAA-383]|uniref:Uncharacterized protein n=1 Tax=Enterococcus moraviensis ATCC BAA-383 TaxID=1158609 RepID=R2SSF8_9ENTE|nr:hypothetical protein UAY_03157 [Enterococcus moraviensis ATCC BAA-383]EOT66218.1 hypothetical protein I586_02489 [Enterococcus moraviensis ATCC BAA-383]OJG67716.1 hypothetical protein RV09_GL002485 [Enterococcus moraviensis]
MKTEPGQNQTLSITIENKEATDIKVDIQTDSATTSALGLVDYSNKEKLPKDESLKYDLKELLTPAQTSYIIPKNSKIDAQLTLQMPKQAFTGILAGGIRITQADTTQTDAVNSKIAYEIGVIIREKDTVLEKQLNYLELKQRSDSLNLVFQNPVSTFINDLSLKTEITKGDVKQKVFSDETKKLQMAPNTQLNFQIPTPENLPAGTYQIKIHASSEKNKWHWTFDDTFHISKQTAKVKKNTALKKQPTSLFIYILIGILIVILLLIALLILLIKQHKLKKEHLKRRKKKKRMKK